uniref:CEP152 CEP63 binding coiled coil domain-containing protein n=1 Tax=Anabas testudineus TaxID=64144 RepID=A0A7N6BEV3_ANATE
MCSFSFESVGLYNLLHKLLTDLPDDMLEDSRDSSSPELEYSTCSNKNIVYSTNVNVSLKGYEVDYNHCFNDYAYQVGAVQVNGHQSHSHSQPLPHTWNQDHPFTQGDNTYTSMGTDHSTETNDFSTDEYESKPYPQGNNNHMQYNRGGGQGDKQNHGDHNCRNHFENLNSAAGDGGVSQYKVSYNPHHPAQQPKMFHSQATQQGQFDHLQREFLDSTQQTADGEQLAQLQILYKAQQRQIEDLERKLEDSRRKMRYVEHQFAIVKDEKDGLTVSLKESSRLVEEAKDREAQMQNKVRAMEQQILVLNERDQENKKKQMIADAAVDSMKQHMLELCRSDTLSRAREQHDRDLVIMKEQHEAALLALQQELDSTSQALNEQIDIGQRLQEQVKQLERQREEEQLERARVVNALTQRLEETQQQCAKLLQTSSVQEMSQIQIKLQQAQSAKALSENMNKVLQDLADLKEQITLYESSVKHGVITLDLSSDWESQLSESCMDLGLKKTNRKNGTLHSTALAHLSDSKLPKDEALQLLRVEMQRCLASLKGKRQKISQLQEELQNCQSQVNELQTQIFVYLFCILYMTGEPKKELIRLQEDKQRLKQQELKQNEEKVRFANSELCTKMREMIQELDQEKQEAAERSERINQQYRDDVVNRVRTELLLEHNAQVEQLTAQHQQEVQQLQTQLSEANDKMLAVQECYISVCKEKDFLEEKMSHREMEENEAVREKCKETAEATCQTDTCKIEDSIATISAEELDSRLSAQKQQLLLEADKVKCKAVEEAKKQAQRDLHEKHLEVMAEHVEGAVTRAYNRWIEDLTSLPEYQAAVQAEREKWEELQEKHIEQQVSQALREAEEQWNKKHKNQLEEQNSGASQVEELQEEVATLQSQLDQVRREQAALLKAELAAARAAWNRDKQEDVNLQKKELLLQLEAKLQQTVKAREEEWRCQSTEREQTLRQQMKDDLLVELQTGLAEVQERLVRDLKTDQQGTEDTRRISEATSESTVTHIIQTSCRDIVNRAVSHAKKEWKKISEETLSRALKETQEQHEREMNKMQSMKECTENLSKMQKKNQELQKNLQKACRHLQHSVREHKTSVQHLKAEHESILQKTKEEHLQQVEEVKRAKQSSGRSDQQNLQKGLEEMKQQYLMTVEKIRGDMLRYLQESRERAAEMIRMEVQRERQDTARKMRRYYLTCLQELLEDGGKTTGAEKKIMNAASKLAAMAKVLETPIKSKSGKNYSLPTDCSIPVSTASADAGMKPQTSVHTHLRSQKPLQKISPPSQVDVFSVSVRSKSRELHLPGGFHNSVDNHLDSEQQGKYFLTQEAPVRDEKQTDWSMTNSDFSFQVPRLSYSGRKVEPVKPFSVSAALTSDFGDFGGLTPNVSDLTVYNEIAKKTPHADTLDFPSAKMSGEREPTPGSEGEKQQAVCSRPLFSELRQRQQDSGFDSPFYQQK